MARKISAGTVLFRSRDETVEVLLVHPKGWVHATTPWGIPKGYPNDGETHEDAARRETWEETEVVPGALVAIGAIHYRRTQKTVHAFAGPAPEGEPRCASHEVDGARYFPLAEARGNIHPDQLPLLDRLEALLAERSTNT
jgi:predicted NUDIX family NTP pyrophosphohydrolase